MPGQDGSRAPSLAPAAVLRTVGTVADIVDVRHLPLVTLPLQDALAGSYEILDKIAEGGIGSIYKVRHRLLEEVRVIKVLRAQVAGRDDLRRRLLQEAKTAIRLDHRNIARLYDLAVAEDGTAYIVMEFIDGVGLDALLRATGPPSVDLSLAMVTQALEALHYLHGKGLIHRDVSPDNLMLTRDRDQVRVKLIDLGIAKDLAAQSRVTAEGTFLGKVKYCAPERFRQGDGAVALDQRSDNYSLAVTLYELLTGVHPFHGDSFEDLVAAHLLHPPRDFETTDPDGRVPQALREVVMNALEKDPAKRPATAAELAERLGGSLAPDEAALRQEAARVVEETSRFVADFGLYRSSGSTQDHLDAQFGTQEIAGLAIAAATVESETPVPAPEPRPPTPSTSHSSRRIPWLLAAGGLAIAGAALLAVWLSGRNPAAPASEESVVAMPPIGRRGDAAAVPSDSATTGPAAELAQAEPASRNLDRPPRPVAPIAPGFPRPERREVVVVVSVLVDAAGEVAAAEVRAGPTFRRRYRAAALAAVEQAAFVAGTRDGQPVEMWVDVMVRFEP